MTEPKTITERVMERAAYDEIGVHDLALKMGYNSYRPTEHKAFEYGAHAESARLLPLIRQLALSNEKLVEALQWCANRERYGEKAHQAIDAHEADMIKILEIDNG
jgi:hypothetical protein